jgi:hypothetical protein
MTRMALQVPKLPVVEVKRGQGHGGPYVLSIAGHNYGHGKRPGFMFSGGFSLPLFLGDWKPEDLPRKELDALLKVEGLLGSFRAALGGIRAIGAFRARPERRYEYAGRTPALLDLGGQNVINALIEDAIQKRKPRLLLQALNRWLKDVCRVRLMPVKRIGKGARLYELRLRDLDSGRWASFADVGFGIGQALPVFVEGLRTPQGGTFLVQEPEIHLHPDAQLGMADFLVSLVKSGRQVIAETHSDHLLVRVRKTVAAGLLDPGQVSVLFVDKGRDGASTVKPISLDRLGNIPEWPKGFMEEAAKERLDLLEQMAKKAEAR